MNPINLIDLNPGILATSGTSKSRKQTGSPAGSKPEAQPEGNQKHKLIKN